MFYCKENFRNNEYIYKQSLKYLIVCDKEYYSDPMICFLKNLDDHLSKSDFFFKNSLKDTTTVGCVSFEEKRYVIKRYNFKNFFHGLKLRFRPSRAMYSATNLQILNKIGIKTPRLIALVEERIGMLRGRAFFITEFIEGICGCEYFADHSTSKSQWPDAIADIGKLTLALNENSLYHGDYHFGNLLMVNDKPLLLDLDSMRVIRNPRKFDKKHQKDINNFKRYLLRNKHALEAFQNSPHKSIFDLL